ncbi:hypothetical protein IWW34DRAFT_758235 [Fusarium oxysporum f. sp. albedinis]|nr:hypothetical protein IWW34DRAFT_758235 [Fusarium oxysporum f. sp. albedinis]
MQSHRTPCILQKINVNDPTADVTLAMALPCHIVEPLASTILQIQGWVKGGRLPDQ